MQVTATDAKNRLGQMLDVQGQAHLISGVLDAAVEGV